MPQRPPTFRNRLRVAAAASDEAQRNRDKRSRYGRDWQAVRATKLMQSPLCECDQCKCDGVLTIATVVHHVIDVVKRPDLRLDLSNLQSLSKPCHDRITRARQVELLG
jgi:5-methylcytosine-specific restriction protein A